MNETVQERNSRQNNSQILDINIFISEDELLIKYWGNGYECLEAGPFWEE